MSVTFRIKASEAHGRRLDPSFYSPQYREFDEVLANCRYECKEIRDLRIEVFQGVSRNLLENDGIRLLKVKNILPDGSIDFADSEPISDVPTNKILKDGDIISPFIGAAIKGYKFGYFEDREGERWTFDNNTGVFRNNDERVLSRYLWSFFQLEITHRQLDRIIGGGGVPYLGAEYAKRLKVILPPLPEQRKIVAELDAAYATKRAADERAAKLLASIDEMVLKELGIANLPKPDTSLSSRIFTVPAREALNDRFDAHYNQNFFRDLADLIREDKRCCRLGSVGTFVRGVTYKSEDEAECGHAILRANNVSLEEFDLDLSDLVYVSSDLAFSPAQQIKDGDILICAASGSKEHAGKVAYVRNAPDDTYIGGFMMVLRTDAGVNPEYVAVYMQSSIFRGLIFRHLGGTNINNVSLELLNKLPLILPDAAMQNGIASKASSIRAEACKLKADATAALEVAKRKIEAKIVKV